MQNPDVSYAFTNFRSSDPNEIRTKMMQDAQLVRLVGYWNAWLVYKGNPKSAGLKIRLML